MILFLYGDNDFMIRREVNRIRGHYKKTAGSALSLEFFDLAEEKFSDLVDSVKAAPLFTNSRLIVVRSLEKNKKAQDSIEGLIESVPDSTIVIIEGQGLDRRSKAFKKLAALPKAVEFKQLNPAQLRSWIKKEAGLLGGEIDQDLAMYLIDLVGTDQWKLSSELQKLVNYNPILSRESIDRLATPQVEATIFLLIEAVAVKDIGRSLKLHKQLGIDGVGDQQIIAMLNWHWRNIVLAIDNSTSSNIDWAKTFGISPFAASKATGLAMRLNLNDCKKAYRLIVAADEAIKSGQKQSNEAILELIYALTR